MGWDGQLYLPTQGIFAGLELDGAARRAVCIGTGVATVSYITSYIVNTATYEGGYVTAASEETSQLRRLGQMGPPPVHHLERGAN